MHCFEYSQHLLMHSDLIGVVARFETTKRLVFGEVDLKLLVLSQVKLLATRLSRQPTIFSSVYQCYVPFFPSMFPSFQPLAIITKCPILDVTAVLDLPQLLTCWMNCMKIILNLGEFSSSRGELNM